MSTDGITQRLRDDLEVAAQTLRRYEALHRAKGTPESTEKAESNASLAERFEKTVRSFDEIQPAIAPDQVVYTRAEVASMLDSLNNSAATFGLEVGFEMSLPNGRQPLVLRKAAPVTVLEAVLRANPLAMPDMQALEHVIPPRFLEVGCSQCGGTFGPGEHGFSSCTAHQGVKGQA